MYWLIRILLLCVAPKSAISLFLTKFHSGSGVHMEAVKVICYDEQKRWKGRRVNQRRIWKEKPLLLDVLCKKLSFLFFFSFFVLCLSTSTSTLSYFLSLYPWLRPPSRPVQAVGCCFFWPSATKVPACGPTFWTLPSVCVWVSGGRKQIWGCINVEYTFSMNAAPSTYTHTYILVRFP